EGERRIIPGRPDVAARSLAGTNIVHLFKQRRGDIARGFRESDEIFDNTFSSPPVNHVALEPHVAVAQVSDGQITVWTCSQNPYVVQRQLAGIFKIPLADVRVIVFTLGGGCGGKLNCKFEPVAALLSKKAGRPVKIIARRNEVFLLGVQHECKFKLKNVLQKGDSFSTGEPMPEMHYNELIASAAEKIGWKDGPLVVREGNKIRAKGISAIVKGMATPTTSTASIKLNADGSLNVLTSSVEMGQGAKTALAQIAAEEIGLPVRRVRVSEPDTAFTPFDLMTAASRATFCMGTAIRRGVQQIKEQMLEAAAAQLEAAKEDLVLNDGR